MRAEWQAHIDELLKEYRDKRAQLRELQELLATLEATSTAADEMVKVTVGPQGQLKGLEFDPRVYRRLSPSELADAIVEAAERAAAEVRERMQGAMEPFQIPEVEGFDLGKVLGGPPRDFDEARERYGFRPKE
ncbi:YbaB/EbfC family nucleoid-associated protein [Thermomonospora cellulosilytica]|uniref:DNA-binding protein YbaB n=1 Tax=Thermomonospora cellulosilytica TaxID=1411118 RepID=A0A7W3R6P4_9ACTN|nr:YbaB/EbfC family nucleoid-associated protein [Thermomonospora cellulosilytica]MBA9001817.1 DNA-binding protein YbaB [Thermomonospora cellulosilytica]